MFQKVKFRKIFKEELTRHDSFLKKRDKYLKSKTQLLLYQKDHEIKTSYHSKYKDKELYTATLIPEYGSWIRFNFQNLRYEGFGPFNVALIIETLTNNKNRSASNIRTILQKNGGRLGENGSTSHLFFSCGVIKIKKDITLDNQIYNQYQNKYYKYRIKKIN